MFLLQGQQVVLPLLQTEKLGDLPLGLLSLPNPPTNLPKFLSHGAKAIPVGS